MSDETSHLAAMAIANLASWSEEQAAQAVRNRAICRTNKAILFPVLAAAGIGIVTVQFDGYGDSGQIESVEARAGEHEAALPDISIALMQARWGSDEPVPCTMTIAEAIEQLAYDLLAQTHAGWENNDGAYGEFVFDVAAGTITLDHNDRYTAVESYSHTF